jgi:hypothetical protein
MLGWQVVWFHGKITLAGWRNLNPKHPLATLFLYVSRLRRPPSSSPPSGDHHAAGPGLKRISKSNERTPAAVPAGFFIASGPRAGKNIGQSK